jgi:hypothetical protein
MSRFDKRYGKSREPADEATWQRPGGRLDDTRYPGDEFGGTYGNRDPREFGGSPYEAGHELPGGRDYGPGDGFGNGDWIGHRGDSGHYPGHRDFGGHHRYESSGRHPGHRDFGRDESPSQYGRGGRDWSGSGYPGGQRGVGPKDYERTDERIRDDVCERLTEHDAIDASSIEVRVTAGVVLLSGDVPQRFMKHLAEDTVAEAVGVKDVENTLRVRGPERRGERGLFDEPSLG